MSTSRKTACIADERYLAHDAIVNHPERPERIKALLELLVSHDRSGAYRVDPRPATEDEIIANHDRELFETVKATRGKTVHVFDPDTAAGAATFDTALLAAGALLSGIDEVMAARADNAFAMVRPPGHHAEPDRAMGFCFFNNVAIGARYLREKHGLERVLIVDWDVHHGNGTQASFYGDPNVLFVSSHQYPHYPGTGAVGETGEGKGVGFTVNAPLPAGYGDKEYIETYRRLVDPIARAFDPQFVLISAGYDAHVRDPLSDMEVTAGGFTVLADIVLAIANDCAGGRCAAVLEGGYSLEGLKEGVGATLDVMGKQECLPPPASESRATAIIDGLIDIQKQYWNI